jgi:acetyl esterase
MPPPFIRPDVRAFLDSIKAANRPKIQTMGPAAAREMAAATRTLTDVPAADLALIRDLAIPRADGATIPARLYDARETRGAGPVLVFFHGGGFVIGDLDSHQPICTEIARVLDIPVVAIAYRLAPEHPWPAAPDDCEAAARWIATAPAALGRTPTGLVCAGDSAGGALAIVTTLALRDRPAAVPVIAQWPIYPVADFAVAYPSYAAFAEGYFLERDGMDWFNACYQADPAHWRAAPLRTSQAGLPPTLVVTASLDPLRDQGRAYAAACVAAGVPTVFREAAGAIHGFVNMRKAIPSVAGDIAGCLAVLKAMITETETAV